MPDLTFTDAELDRLADVLADRLAARGGAAEGWVGVQQAATHLGCKRQRIYDLVHDRAIPHRKEGSRLLFRLSELDEWLESK